MSLKSENDLLERIALRFPETHGDLLVGRGDDCAVLQSHPDSCRCVSTDLFLENVHFRRSYFRAEEIGYKALAVNISDIAASGGRPKGFTLSLGLPPDTEQDWFDAFIDGMAEAAQPYQMALAGGDLSSSPFLHVCITIWGDVNPEFLLTRGNGMPGDTLFVVGELGLARVGLEELETHGNAARELWPAACAAHLKPRPQVDAGLMLVRAGRYGRPPALMDLSDGMARDLPRLLGMSGSGTKVSGRSLGAELVLPRGLLPAETVRHAEAHGRDPVMEAFLGGEDYALLGCCAPDMLPALQAAIPQFMAIGTVTDSGYIVCNGLRLGEDMTGFDHFGKG